MSPRRKSSWLRSLMTVATIVGLTWGNSRWPLLFVPAYCRDYLFTVVPIGVL